MKKLLLGVLCLVVSSTVFAGATTYKQPAIADGTMADAARVMHQYATTQRALVASEGPDYAFLFAVVGSTAGANGTYFRSEVTLVNNDTMFRQNVMAIYFPSGGGSCNNGSVKIMTLEPDAFYTYNDFVNQVFNTSGLGSVVILGVDSANNLDTTANLDGFSRIWTPVAGFQGTASQSFPAVAISGYPGAQYIYGLHTDSGFRTNVFIFNYLPTVSSSRTFGLNFVGSNSQTGSNTISVAPCSLGVYSIAGNYASTMVKVTPPDSGGGWFAFGSTVDNLSGDNWSSPARPDNIH